MMDANALPGRTASSRSRSCTARSCCSAVSSRRGVRRRIGLRGGPDRPVSCKMSGVQDLISVYRALVPTVRLRRCTWASPKPAWAPRGPSPRPPRSRCCFRKASATPFGSRSRRSRARPAPRKWWSRSKSCRRSACGSFNPSVTACPGCGRTTSTTFQELAKQIDDYLRAQMPVWKARYPGVEKMKVAVMGCIVNGPGESKHADIGISLPGNGEAPAAPVFIDGEKALDAAGRRHRQRVPCPGRALHRAPLRDRCRDGARRAPGHPALSVRGRCRAPVPALAGLAARPRAPTRPDPHRRAPRHAFDLCESRNMTDITKTSRPEPLQAVKGMNDILPAEAARWEWFEARVRALMTRYGYANVRTPSVEPTALVRPRHRRGDRHRRERDVLLRRFKMNGDRLTLRPEATAGIVRAMIQHDALLRNGPLRVWSEVSAPCSGTNGRRRAAIGSSTRSTWKRSASPARTWMPSRS